MNNNCCKFLLHQLVFFPDTIGPCCSVTIEGKPLRVCLDNKNNASFDLSKYIETRDSIIKIFNNGGEPYCYKSCQLYQDEDSSNENKESDSIFFDYIVISNRTKCNCNCIYCEQSRGSSEIRKEENLRETYDIVPILENLKQQSLIAEECNFIISGGECAEYPKEELEYLLNLVKFYNGSVLILSSGIKYSEAIASILESGNAQITISVDSGTRETYEKIKRVKTHDNVWNNLRKYTEAASKNENAIVEAKYIVIPEVNDSIKEAKAFIDKCKSIKCNHIKVEIEHLWMYKNFEQPLSAHLKEIFRYFMNTTKAENLHFKLEGVGEQWLLKKLDE